MARHLTGTPTADQVDPQTPDLKAAAPSPEQPDPAPVAPGTDPANVEMLKLKTTGEFMLMDPWSGRHFTSEASEPAPKTQFVIDRLADGNLEEA